MALETLHFTNREEWLRGRENSIGGSDAAAVVGLSPWMSATELWEIKTGYKTQASITNESIERGNLFEPALRNLFQVKHPEYKHDYYQFDIFYQTERPWLTATLDGLFTYDEAKHGILEIKTATMNNAAAWKKWDNAVPDGYYVQVLHQLLVTGFEKAVLFACLFNLDNDMTVREYEFQRSDCESDMAWLLEKETEFWHKVQTRTMPNTMLKL